MRLVSRVAPLFLGHPTRKRDSAWSFLIVRPRDRFLKGWFVVYQRSNQAVLVASTADDLDLALDLPKPAQPNHGASADR